MVIYICTRMGDISYVGTVLTIVVTFSNENIIRFKA
jgi:hypothetical protein